jgi:hypothetical protein
MVFMMAGSQGGDDSKSNVVRAWPRTVSERPTRRLKWTKDRGRWESTAHKGFGVVQAVSDRAQSKSFVGRAAWMKRIEVEYAEMMRRVVFAKKPETGNRGVFGPLRAMDGTVASD